MANANTNIITISTSQAPDAKPVVANLTVSTNWQTLISVPNYEVPELVFGGSNTVEPGVGEVISPIILCNFTANTVSVDIQIWRYDQIEHFWVIKGLRIPGNDTVPLPLNGQFFKSGDELEIKADTSYAVDATLSYTLGQSEEDDV
jgi:hypothetical protein